MQVVVLHHVELSRRASHGVLTADTLAWFLHRDWSQSGKSPTPLQRLQTGAGAGI